MQTVKFFQISKNSDLTEGRGHEVPLPIGFWTMAEAHEFVKSKDYARKYGVQGMPGGDWSIKEVELNIYDSSEECSRQFMSEWECSLYDQHDKLISKAKEQLNPEQFKRFLEKIKSE